MMCSRGCDVGLRRSLKLYGREVETYHDGGCWLLYGISSSLGTDSYYEQHEV